MGVHGIVAGIGGVAGLLAGGQKVHKSCSSLFRHTAGHQRRLDVLLVLVGHVHGELVAHIADERAVQLLIEGRVEVLLEEFLGRGQALERHAGGLAVAGSGHIGPTGGGFPQAQPAAASGKKQCQEAQPPAGRIHQEALVAVQVGFGADEADVLSQVFHALAVHGEGGSGRGGGRRGSPAQHLQRKGGRVH